MRLLYPVTHREDKKLLAKNTILTFLGQVVPMLIALLTMPRVVKGLGADGYGLLSVALIVLGYFGMFDLGLSRATTKFVAESLTPDGVHRVPELIWTSVTVLLALGCAAGLTLAALTPIAVTHVFRMPPCLMGQARFSFFVLAASMPILLANEALRGVLEAAQRFDLVTCVKIPCSTLFYSVAALAIPFGITVSGIVVLLVSVRCASALAYLLMCLAVIPRLRSCVSISREAFRPLARFGGWITLSTVTGPILGYLERFLIASTLSVSFLTYYSVPFDFVAKVLIFPASMAPALFPYFSYHGAQDTGRVSRVTSNSLRVLLLVITPVTALLVCFAGDILRLWMGSPFPARSTGVFQLLAFACFLNSFAYVPYSSVQALGRPDLKAILDLIVLPTYALLCWAFLHWLGISGAALAKLMTGVVDTGCLFFFARRLGAFALKDCLSGPLFRGLVMSSLLLAAAWLIFLMRLDLCVSFVAFLVCSACYAGGCWGTVMDTDERSTIRRYLRLSFRAAPESAS